MTDRVAPMLAYVARRVPIARGRSGAAQIWALASSIALAAAIVIAAAIPDSYGLPAFVVLPVVLAVLTPGFHLIAGLVIERRARRLRARQDAVSLEEQIEAAFDADLDRIERLGVSDQTKQTLRLKAYQRQHCARSELRGARMPSVDTDARSAGHVFKRGFG